MKTTDQPHRKWKHRLKNGVYPGDPSKAPRCGAKTRRGSSCMSPAMKNGRCRMHGGKSTGPKTPEGLERARKANWKHGWHSKEEIARRQNIQIVMGYFKETLKELT